MTIYGVSCRVFKAVTFLKQTLQVLCILCLPRQVLPSVEATLVPSGKTSMRDDFPYKAGIFCRLPSRSSIFPGPDSARAERQVSWLCLHYSALRQVWTSNHSTK